MPSEKISQFIDAVLDQPRDSIYGPSVFAGAGDKRAVDGIVGHFANGKNDIELRLATNAIRALEHWRKNERAPLVTLINDKIDRPPTPAAAVTKEVYLSTFFEAHPEFADSQEILCYYLDRREPGKTRYLLTPPK